MDKSGWWDWGTDEVMKDLRARVTELEAQLAKQTEKNTKFRKRFREFAQYARYQDGRANSITELYIETADKLADLRETAERAAASLDHAIIFISTRERMHKDGIKLHEESLRDLRAAIGEG